MQANRFIADSLIEHSVILLRLVAGAKIKVQTIFDAMATAIVVLLVAETVNEITVDNVLQSAGQIISDHYEQIGALVALKLTGVALAQSAMLDRTLAEIFQSAAKLVRLNDAALTDISAHTLIQGANNTAWWEQQAVQTDFALRNAVRQGLRNGDTVPQIIARVRGDKHVAGVLDGARNSAFRIVNSAVAAVANESRVETFQQNRDVINGIEQISTLDGHTSPVCIAYSGAQWDMDYAPIAPTTLPYNGGIPRHWNCRSVMVPLTKTFAELGIDAPEFQIALK